MSPRIALSLAALLLPVVASAVPMELNHQGRLLDSSGTPLSSTEDVTFSLYSTAGATDAAWTETHSVTFDGGYYSVQLGSIEALDSDLFSGDALYVGITVGTDAELADRHAVVSVPYAITAGSVAGGSVDASSVSVGGTEIINSSGEIDYAAIVNTPANPLADLTCSGGEVVAWDGTEWICGAGSPAHVHDGDDITTGKLDVARLPVGTGGTEVAAGDHTHDAADIVSGRLSNDQLPTAISADSITSSSFVQLGGSTLTCDGKSAGAVRHNSTTNRVEACLTGGWVPLAIEQGTVANPATSCAELYEDGVRASGAYWFDPDGSGTPYQTYCDMETDGGGWTLVLKVDDSNPAELRYAGALWTSEALLNEDDFAYTPGVAKLESFNDVPFQTMRACFPSQGNYCFSHTLAGPQDSALASFSAGTDEVQGHPGINTGWSTQPNCKRFGVNPDTGGRKVRFGYSANQENDCNSNDTSLGFGAWSNAAGIECTSSQCSLGNVNAPLAAYLWVR